MKLKDVLMFLQMYRDKARQDERRADAQRYADMQLFLQVDVRRRKDEFAAKRQGEKP